MRDTRSIPTTDAYVAVGRKLLAIDNDAQYAIDEDGNPLGYAEYWRDIAAKAFVVDEHEDAARELSSSVEGIQVNPIKLGVRTRLDLRRDIAKTPYNRSQRMLFRCFDSLDRLEDVEILKLINNACSADHTISVSGTLQPENLNLAKTLIEEHSLPVGCIVLHPQRFKDVKGWDFGDMHIRELRFCSKKETKITGIGAWWDDIPFYVTTMCAKNAVFILADPEYVGVVAPFGETVSLHTGSNIKPVKEAGQGNGWDIVRKVAMAVINDYAVARIVVS